MCFDRTTYSILSVGLTKELAAAGEVAAITAAVEVGMEAKEVPSSIRSQHSQYPVGTLSQQQ